MDPGSPGSGLPAADGSQEGAAADQPEGDAAPALSKKQQKKLLKKQNVEAHRLAKKAKKKAQHQHRQAVKKASIDQMLAQMPEDKLKEWREQQEKRTVERITAKQEQRAALAKAVDAGQKLVIDLDFDGMMLDKELKSLMQQLSYSYSACMRSQNPSHLHLLGASGAVKERMQSQLSGLENWVATVSEQRWQDFFKDRLSDLVYLTADAEHELQTLNPNHIYIIGGLVDRNRYKSECFNRARKACVATARLPIGQYVKLASSQVITINQVVDILVGFQAKGDWRTVLESVLPMRKVAAEDDREAEAPGAAGDAAAGNVAAENAAAAGNAAAAAAAAGDAAVENAPAGDAATADNAAAAGQPVANGPQAGTAGGAEEGTGVAAAGAAEAVAGAEAAAGTAVLAAADNIVVADVAEANARGRGAGGETGPAGNAANQASNAQPSPAANDASGSGAGPSASTLAQKAAADKRVKGGMIGDMAAAGNKHPESSASVPICEAAKRRSDDGGVGNGQAGKRQKA